MNPFSLFPQKYFIYAGVAILILGGGMWWAYVKGTDKSALIIADYKAQVVNLNTALETEKANVKERVIVKYKTKIVHINDVGDHNANVAKNNVHSQCVMSDGWVYVHDAAATGIAADSTRAANGATSGIKDTEALVVINDNYKTFLNQKAQLESLQQWIIENNAAIAAANATVKKKHWWSK